MVAPWAMELRSGVPTERSRPATRASTATARLTAEVSLPSTKSIRPPVSYTNHLKAQQLAASRFKDKTPSHYEEDHFISLELGGNPRDPRNLWPEMWGTPGTPLTSRGPFPPHLVGAKAKDAVENQLHKEICAGTLTLHEAQQIITTDWFKYYREQVLK